MNINIVKIGGRPASETRTAISLFRELKALSEMKDQKFVLVHGGGADVTELSRKLGMEPLFENGIRITTDLEMPLVDAVLAGMVNKRMVRQAQGTGLDAVGISGSDGKTFTGKALSPESHTGNITKTNPELIISLIEAGFFPVISSVSMEENGKALNINADEAALALAESLKASSLVFLSDIPGILKDGNIIPELTEQQAEQEITDLVIKGGMIPKVRSSLGALKAGVRCIVIGNYEEAGDLKALLAGNKGTCLIKKDVL